MIRYQNNIRSGQSGGVRKILRAVYGHKGEKEPPPQDVFNYQKRLHTWTDMQKNRSCAWHPLFESKQVDCGGRRCVECSKYGITGSRRAEAPSEKELAWGKKRAIAQKRRTKI